MSEFQRNRIVQHFLVAATSLCVGMILARAMGF